MIEDYSHLRLHEARLRAARRRWTGILDPPAPARVHGRDAEPVPVVDLRDRAAAEEELAEAR